jgi:hypothetical protein
VGKYMHIEYETTLGELADENLRLVTRSKIARRTRWKSTLWVALLSGMLIFIILTFLGATLPERFTYSALGATMIPGVYWLSYWPYVNHYILMELRERMQGDGPFRFAVELQDDCLWIEQGGVRVAYDWKNVEVKQWGRTYATHFKQWGRTYATHLSINYNVILNMLKTP